MLIVVFFFFSSRRRHTRLQGDWSSDVCSSDLGPRAEPLAAREARRHRPPPAAPDTRRETVHRLVRAPRAAGREPARRGRALPRHVRDLQHARDRSRRGGAARDRRVPCGARGQEVLRPAAHLEGHAHRGARARGVERGPARPPRATGRADRGARALVPPDVARRVGGSPPHRRRTDRGAARRPARRVPHARARARPRAPVHRRRPDGAPARALPPESARRHGPDGRGPPVGRLPGGRGRFRVLRDGGRVRLRARALRHLCRARQSPPGARREGGARGHRDRGARRLVPPADRAPRRAPRVPPRRSPPGRAIALLLGSALAVLVAAFVKGAIGFGFPTLGTPLLALFLDVKTAVAVLVVPNLVMDGIQARRRGGLAATVRRLRPLLLSGAAGTVLGTAALAELGAQTVTLALGGFVGLFVILNAMRVAPRGGPSWGRWLSAPVGLVAGVVGGVTNVPSLPLILYFYALGMEKDEFVRSIAVTFLAYKLVQLVSLVTVGLLDGRLFGASLALTAVAVGAFALGLRVQDRLDARAFNRAVLVFLSAIGVWLVVRALR